MSEIKSHKEVRQYLSEMMDGNPKRIEEARLALIRTGVLDKDGKKKDTIVSWK